MDKQTVFIHIPRTAGTAFGTLVAASFKERGKKVCTYTNWPQFCSATDLHTYDLIGGHTYYPLVRLLKGTPIFITMLGEPVGRLISHLHFLRNAEDPELKGRTVEECLTNLYFRVHYNNFQTRQLGVDFVDIKTDSDFGTHAQASKENLEFAKERLKQFAFVGIKEYFYATLQNYNRIFGTNLATDEQRPRPWKAGLSPRELKLAEELVEFDTELFKFALKFFREGQYGGNTG